MPKFLPPNHLSAHRLAAIALYRALLTQSRAVLLPLNRREELRHLIRARFKQWRNQQSTKRLRVAFCGGYQALDKLDGAVAGDQDSIAHIIQLLGRVPDRHKQPNVVIPSTQKPNVHVQERSILDRPRPLHELSGKRHVPRLVNALGIPILRIKKPQPASLSGYIAKRVRRRIKRIDLSYRMVDKLALAKQEDAWDAFVAAEQDSETVESNEPSWDRAPLLATELLNTHYERERSKTMEMARRMQDIVDRERALVHSERRARRRAVVKLKRQVESAGSADMSSSNAGRVD